MKLDSVKLISYSRNEIMFTFLIQQNLRTSVLDTTLAVQKVINGDICRNDWFVSSSWFANILFLCEMFLSLPLSVLVFFFFFFWRNRFDIIYNHSNPPKLVHSHDTVVDLTHAEISFFHLGQCDFKITALAQLSHVYHLFIFYMYIYLLSYGHNHDQGRF